MCDKGSSSETVSLCLSLSFQAPSFPTVFHPFPPITCPSPCRPMSGAGGPGPAWPCDIGCSVRFCSNSGSNEPSAVSWGYDHGSTRSVVRSARVPLAMNRGPGGMSRWAVPCGVSRVAGSPDELGPSAPRCPPLLRVQSGVQMAMTTWEGGDTTLLADPSLPAEVPHAPSVAAVSVYTNGTVFATDTDITFVAVTKETTPLEFTWFFGEDLPVRTRRRSIQRRLGAPQWCVVVLTTGSCGRGSAVCRCRAGADMM